MSPIDTTTDLKTEGFNFLTMSELFAHIKELCEDDAYFHFVADFEKQTILITCEK